jgi:hypothetical protein
LRDHRHGTPEGQPQAPRSALPPVIRPRRKGLRFRTSFSCSGRSAPLPPCVADAGDVQFHRRRCAAPQLVPPLRAASMAPWPAQAP